MKKAKYLKFQKDIKEATKAYDKYAKKAQQLRIEKWNNFIGSLQNIDIWKANRYIKL